MNEEREYHLSNIAVTGVGGGVGQSVLRALRLSSLPWHVIGGDMSPWSAGIYTCHRGYIFPPARDASYVERLIQILVQEQVQILIPGTDPELSVLAEAKERLSSEGVLTIVGSAEAVRYCRDKLAAYRFFHEHGLPFVRTVPACEGFQLAEKIGFPLVIKPIGGSASQGAAVVFDRAQLSQYVRQENMIVQEYLVPQSWGKSRQELTIQDVIEGHRLRQEDEISSQILFDHKGNFLGQFTSRNVLKDGVPISIDPGPYTAVERIVQEMADLLVNRGLIGPCNFQCKLTARGPVFFEINPRFTGITAARAAMGFNGVDAILRRALIDEPVGAVRQRLRVPEDLVCSRYVTEMIIPRAELKEIQGHGHVEGHGYGTTL